MNQQSIERDRQGLRIVRRVFAVLLFATCASVGAFGQSSQLESPTPVTSNVLDGRIPALDIGDSRLTHHYYIFTGTKGDLILTVTSNNLNGDIDVFTAKALRPLVKIGLYSTESGSVTSKTVFLHDREQLILRVEARSPNDESGEYKISFAGGFEPLQGGIGANQGESTQTSGVARGTHRVTSVGATIEEPKPEPTPVISAEANARPVATPSPTPTPSENSASTTEPEAKPSPTPQKKVTPHRSTGNRRTAASPKPRTKPATEASAKPAEPAPADNSAVSAPPKQEIPVPPSAKIIVELKDGTRIEHSMTSVRRVLIDNGQIVIINNNGKIERLPMANVLRMAIEP